MGSHLRFKEGTTALGILFSPSVAFRFHWAGDSRYSAPNVPRQLLTTKRQKLGIFGEQCVVRNCICPHCKRAKSLIRLPKNFKCADVICDFCGYLAQVKTATSKHPGAIPNSLLGAGWTVQKQRMDAAIYFPLFLVLVTARTKRYAIYYLPADLQNRQMFQRRRPLSDKARRAGYVGTKFNLAKMRALFVRVWPPPGAPLVR
jgi:hypothetical protein